MRCAIPFMGAAMILTAHGATALTVTARYTDRAAFEAATGTSVVEDFEDDAPGFLADGSTTVFDGFELAVTLNGDVAGVVGASAGEFSPPNSGNASFFFGQFPNTVANGDGGQGPELRLSFDSPISALGFDWSDQDLSDDYGMTVEGELVDLGGTNPREVPWPDTPTQALGFFGFTTDEPFTEVVIEHRLVSGSLGDMGIDNLTFVPLPPALPLAAAGFGGLTLLASPRRR